MLAAITPFDAVDSDAGLVEIEIVAGEQPDLRGAQAVTVGDEKDGVVAAAAGLGGLEQPSELVLRQVVLGVNDYQVTLA